MAGELRTAISNLEAVTDQLRMLEASLDPQRTGTLASSVSAPRTLVSTTNGRAAHASGGDTVAAYEQLLTKQLASFMAAATAVGGEVLQASTLTQTAFKEQKKLLLLASHAKRPDMVDLQPLLQPVAELMMAVSAMAENRRSRCFQQLKVLGEAMQGLSWLAYAGPNCGMPAPPQHVAEAWNAAEFYSNKLLQELRGVDDVQVAWLRAVKELFLGFQAFVSANCPGGLPWSASGSSMLQAKAALDASSGSSVSAGSKSAAAATPAGPKPPPPPPPPPPPGLLLQPRQAPASGPQAAAPGPAAGGMQEVLKALNKGSSVTSGLRKVTDDMKSKARADRSGRVGSGAAPLTAARQPSGGATTSPPRIALEQERKWVVENHKGQAEVLVEVANPKHSVYIYNCSGSVVQVRGKCNAISIDKCCKMGVVFADVIASCELVNCTSIQVQCTSAVPTLSVDKCDGVLAYIPQALADNPDFQLVTAKASEVNLVVVAAEPQQQDAAEHAVPEQFISTFKNGRLVTVAASHGGG